MALSNKANLQTPPIVKFVAQMGIKKEILSPTQVLLMLLCLFRKMIQYWKYLEHDLGQDWKEP